MNNFAVRLSANGESQLWFVRCASRAEAEELVMGQSGSLAAPTVEIQAATDVEVAILNLNDNIPRQWF